MHVSLCRRFAGGLLVSPWAVGPIAGVLITWLPFSACFFALLNPDSPSPSAASTPAPTPTTSAAPTTPAATCNKSVPHKRASQTSRRCASTHEAEKGRTAGSTATPLGAHKILRGLCGGLLFALLLPSQTLESVPLCLYHVGAHETRLLVSSVFALLRRPTLNR